MEKKVHKLKLLALAQGQPVIFQKKAEQKEPRYLGRTGQLPFTRYAQMVRIIVNSGTACVCVMDQVLG